MDSRKLIPHAPLILKPNNIKQESGEEIADIGKNTNNESQTALIYLAKHAFDTPIEHMAEMTNIPLDQVTPLSMMVAFAQEFYLFCSDLIDAQAEYNNIRLEAYEKHKKMVVDYNTELQAEWDKKKSNKGKICPDLIPVPEAPVLVDLEKDPDYNIGDLTLLSLDWLLSYYQHRRSVGGDHKYGAITLASDQIQANAGMNADGNEISRLMNQ